MVASTLPQPAIPFVDPSNGLLARPWWYYFQRLFARTGGATGGDFGPPAPIDLTGSPFRYVAPVNGFVMVSGGGVTRLRLSVDALTWYACGAFYGSFSMTSGMTIEATYVRAPVMTFFPASA